MEFKKITELDPLLELLKEFRKLKELQLYGNRLRTLPKELGQYLPELTTLDVCNNLIDSEDIAGCIPGLQSLPKLQHLQLTINE